LDCHFFSAAQASIPVIYEELCGSLTECLPPTRLPEAMQLLGMNPTEQDVAWQILVSRIDRGKSCCYEESFLIPFYFLEAKFVGSSWHSEGRPLQFFSALTGNM